MASGAFAAVGLVVALMLASSRPEPARADASLDALRGTLARVAAGPDAEVAVAAQPNREVRRLRQIVRQGDSGIRPGTDKLFAVLRGATPGTATDLRTVAVTASRLADDISGVLRRVRRAPARTRAARAARRAVVRSLEAGRAGLLAVRRYADSGRGSDLSRAERALGQAQRLSRTAGAALGCPKRCGRLL
jgi:hypothetical protein